MTVRSRVSLMVALSVSVAAGAALILAGGAPAEAAPVKPPVPVASDAPVTIPSHPLTVTVPGLATISVDVPDVPALLGSGRQTTRAQTSTDGDHAPPTAASTAAAPKAASPARPSATAAPTHAAPTPGRVLPVRQSSPAPRTVDSVRPEATQKAPRARHGRTAPVAKPRPLAAVFEGMLHPGLPVWLLLGVVIACGAGTLVVVRSAGRRSIR